MKKIFRGYTLAEVLICLAIVGIIAAMVLPSLISKAGKNVNANSVARTVELIQNGMANIMQMAQNRNEEGTAPANLASIQLSDIMEDGGDDYITDNDNLFALTMGIMGTEEVEDYNVNNIRDYSGNELEDDLLSDVYTYKFKKVNSVIIFQGITGNRIVNAEDNDVITRIIIDANGPDTPNRVGQDVFLFGLTNSGHMVPAGSDAYNDNIFNEAIVLYQDNNAGCLDNITTGLPCAARLMADGWHINY